MSYFQSLRVERAVHLLKTSKASVDDFATKVGYTDGERCGSFPFTRFTRRLAEMLPSVRSLLTTC
jgi:transcriptional regulator GlxA family with amidase domain